MSVGNDVVVIGGGIAGVSAAYYLALSGACDSITLVEQEAQLAFHTTGRSAALLIENYGAGPLRPLTTASLDFFHNPPPELVDHGLIEKRGILTMATSPDAYSYLDTELRQGQSNQNPVVEINVAHAAELAPHVTFGDDYRIMWEEHAFDIDVAALHQAFVRGFRRAGGQIETSKRVDAATRDGSAWSVETNAGTLRADYVVNAAGAWGDQVAERAGIAAIGLAPLRRTAFMVSSPFEDSATFPTVAEVHHNWYLRPDGNQFMCSPADETPSEPCDARAEEIDIARTIEMINEHTTLGIRSINSQWAGLRTFSPDRSMVIGPDPAEASFIWCVGQGGTGIQTAPGAGQLVADLLLHGEPGRELIAAGVDPVRLSAERFR